MAGSALRWGVGVAALGGMARARYVKLFLAGCLAGVAAWLGREAWDRGGLAEGELAQAELSAVAGRLKGGAPVIEARVVAEYPHNPRSFTQGLEFRDGVLYEGTGNYGESSLRIVDLDTGAARNLLRLPDQYFGEGITVVGERVLQLTWKSRIGFVYERGSLRRIGEFRYDSEGWGLANDGTRLFMSDGTAKLRFRDLEDFSETGSVEVRDGDGPVELLNELEYVKGSVLANVWHSDYIARIDPETGLVRAWIDLRAVAAKALPRRSPEETLNGIAYDAEGDRLFVTGKRWPKLYEIELLE